MNERDTINQKNVIVIGNPKWRPSLLGLVANNLAEEFGKPAFLWGRDGDNIIKGSCRSGGTVSVVEIMNKVSLGTLMQYGGHFASGGFVVSNDGIHHLDDHLNLAFDLLSKDDAISEIKYIDMEIPLEKIDWNTYNEIEKMAPFGIGNTKPLFIFKNIKVFKIK